jgi:taurine-pyruvate aminotransferase
VSSEEVEDRERREPAMTDKVGKAISGCKEREPIVGKNGDTIAGYNNVIALAPTLIVSYEDLAFISGTLKESLYAL